ncbi:MAG: 2-C-methyl-D-erythritol 2,4-cyclodiphosphate synthase [Gammaproteobacteria bacterium]|nr:2-C-methyl-D-erythritol 2,4-cyclodiphosphate synthase [Gammaproteobacteria bacterium]
MMRIGHGYDAHQFEAGKQLILCGVEIPHESGLKAHSDGDVALHALCDAILGAAALGDIGRHFPDNSAEYAGIDSRILLREVLKLMLTKGYQIANVDLTILAEAPKLAPHIEQMVANIASDLRLDDGNVNVKATTTEKMGFVGRAEGISAHAVVLLHE